mgnify:CR=1 FL=1|jgi:hypothetical protein|tara:strand:- start:1369 stop:1779 length:411 start_codon:yes stop_codon:yes gene_type:complete
MKKFKDPNYIAKLEKAISKKYGVEAIENPRKHWSDLDEKEYEKQLQKLTKKQNRLHDQSEKIEVDGVLISKKLLNRERVKRSCPVCREYSFNLKDDAYMSKFECCHKCYIEYIQGIVDGEEKWLAGWRPKKLQEKN